MKPFFLFPVPSVRGVFLARPQRFLMEAKLTDGAVVLAYCANPGSFHGCYKKGCPVVLWESSGKSRRRKYTWRAIKLSRIWIGTDTHLANKLVEKTLREKRVPALKDYQILKNEPVSTSGGRLDFLLKSDFGLCFLEVKSATIVTGSTAQFPDSLSPRAVGHLRELKAKVEAGHRAVLLFLVQRGDVRALRINRCFDPTFTDALDKARAAGVEVIAIKHSITLKGFGSPTEIPVLV